MFIGYFFGFLVFGILIMAMFDLDDVDFVKLVGGAILIIILLFLLLE